MVFFAKEGDDDGDDELFAKNFFKQKRILIIIIMIVLAPKKCVPYLLSSLTVLGTPNQKLANGKSMHLLTTTLFQEF